MNKVSLSISSVAEETGQLLTDYLLDRGVYGPRAEAVVCYGSPRHVSHMLNGNCGTDKITRLIRMEKCDVRTVPWFQGNSIPLHNVPYPLLARKAHGHGGTDIVPVFQPQEIPWRIAAGWDWFSSYIPVAHEYRVWIFRGTHLDTYEKVMVRPANYKYVGRNFRNGFDFEPVVVAPKQARDLAEDVIVALELDFAAVDMIQGTDGTFYVLEANTAPGVIKSGAHNTLGKLADHIAKWVEDGYPEFEV